MVVLSKSVLISIGIYLCILMPKINLINIPGFYQGIRYDDIFLLIGIIYIMLQQKLSLNVLPGRKSYFVFFGFILINGFISSFFYGYVSFLIALRWVEYTIFFMLLFYSALSHKNTQYFVLFYIYLNFFVALLQYYGYIGGIYSFGYVSGGDTYVTNRVPGITGGAWELPAILALFIIPIIADKSLQLYMKIFVIILASPIVYVSGTRTGMIVYIISVLLSFITYYRIRLFNLIFVFAIAIIFIGQSRMSFITTENFKIPYSMKVRFDGWYTKFTGMDEINYYFGKGLGYSGKVVDGMIARTFLDFGLFGLALYTIYYFGFLKKYKIIMLILLLYSVSIDVFSSSKIMFSLFMTIYYLKMIENKQYLMVYK